MTSSDRDVILWVCTKTGEQEIRGRELGRSSSRTKFHSHNPQLPPEPYKRCSACRWTEITVVRPPDGGYVLVSEGLSDLEGEIPYGRIYTAESGEEVVQGLYRTDRRSHDEEEQFLPTVARKALINASGSDPEIAEAMRTRGFIR